MIKYTVEINKFDGQEEYIFCGTSAKCAEKTAREEAEKLGDEANVFISFTNNRDRNNSGYLNFDGHGPVGKAW